MTHHTFTYEHVIQAETDPKQVHISYYETGMQRSSQILTCFVKRSKSTDDRTSDITSFDFDYCDPAGLDYCDPAGLRLTSSQEARAIGIVAELIEGCKNLPFNCDIERQVLDF